MSRDARCEMRDAGCEMRDARCASLRCGAAVLAALAVVPAAHAQAPVAQRPHPQKVGSSSAMWPARSDGTAGQAHGVAEAPEICNLQSAICNQPFVCHRDVRSLSPCEDGGVRVTTGGGVLRLRPDGSWETLPPHAAGANTARSCLPAGAAPPPGVGAGEILTATATLGDRLYLAASNGLWAYAQVTAGPGKPRTLSWRRVPYPEGSPATHVSALAPAGRQLAAAFYGDGVYLLDRGKWRRMSTATGITCLAAAGETLWAGGAGVVWRLTPRPPSPQSFRLPDGPPDNRITALARLAGRLWVGTLDGGVASFNGAAWHPFGRAEGVPDPWIRALAVHDGRLWCLHRGGAVSAYDGNRWGIVDKRAGLKRWAGALLAAAGRLWFGLAGGVAALGSEGWSYDVPEGLARETVTALAEQGGGLWIGTAWTGLYRRDGRTGAWSRLDESAGLPDCCVTALAVAGADLWLGTYAGGLARVHDGRVMERLVPPVGPRAAHVTALAMAPDGSLWVGTQSGPAVRAGGEWLTLPDAEAWSPREVLSLLPETDGCWIGTGTGLYHLGAPGSSGPVSCSSTPVPPNRKEAAR